MQHPDATLEMASAAFGAERFKRLIDQPFVVAGVHRHPGEQLRGAPHPVLAATERQQDPDPLSLLSFSVQVQPTGKPNFSLRLGTPSDPSKVGSCSILPVQRPSDWAHSARWRC
ncbi:hypothetical protein [Rhodococcus aetherivorans]|uniref:hypothetical protein n=1 Tax=Rhodococcus aetherivorans TaxID=191292 RepID=UPI001639FD32|nr:hypothetical protein [Rhodococcus aetherivorans]MBC2592547.1 hypothetical protein [Rhodococcus aetherivorans]